MSGDLLGGILVGALRERFPDAEFYGVTGTQMEAAGCRSIASIDALSVMGIAEVIPALPRILRLRRMLFERFSVDRPDRSEERRVGKECVSKCRSRLSPYP